ncbi:hypothetical protein DWB77_07214 [Streptomyces hundungensis]|uniref:Uncharacterized protein n=1 Tax=Streptomyces hundungensis TaxID=1077946 RepID=A0A387HNA2_9ACTN|nr:hypothetical protein [Streptomyces hundungensis]AYG84999.1 hypothetical protein DWB77_07214 [Streptomyces hundungensis]
MNDLLHKLVSAAIAGALIALVGYLSANARRRRAAREEAAAAARTGGPAQEVLRQARELDRSRDELAAQGRGPEALARAGEAAEAWRVLAETWPGRFRAERRDALLRQGALLDAAGQTHQAARIRQDAAGLS